MDMYGGGGRGIARCRKSIHMSPDVYDDVVSTNAEFHPKHFTLHPRLRARHDTSNSTLQSIYQPI